MRSVTNSLVIHFVEICLVCRGRLSLLIDVIGRSMTQNPSTLVSMPYGNTANSVSGATLTHFGKVRTPRVFAAELGPCHAVFLEKFDTSDTFLRIPDTRQKKFDANIKPSGVYIVSPDRLSRFPIHPSPTSLIGTPKDGRNARRSSYSRSFLEYLLSRRASLLRAGAPLAGTLWIWCFPASEESAQGKANSAVLGE